MRCILKTEFGYYKRAKGKPGWVQAPEDAQVFDSVRKVRDLIKFLGENVWHPVIEPVKRHSGTK
jgi:hypothetical protein